jgi:predicted DNA binding CopG/RHH family protein
MEYYQTKIRLSQATIYKIKAIAEVYGLSYSSMCQKILEDAISSLEEIEGESNLLSPTDGLATQTEFENSRQRQINLKMEKERAKHSEYSEEAVAYIYNQLRDIDGFN